MPINYCLEADVHIKDWTAFKDKYPNAGTLIRERLASVGIKLIHSLRTETPDGPTFYNYWHVGPNLNTLPEKEIVLSDDPLWMEFCNVLQKEEEKDFVVPLISVRQTTPPSGFDPKTWQYFCIEYSLEHFGVLVLKDRLEKQLVNYGLGKGWVLGNTYVNLTGLEGRVVQIWLIPPGSIDIDAELAALPWLGPINGREILREKDAHVFKPSEFDVDDPIAASSLGSL